MVKPMFYGQRPHAGFTLAEILIALALIGLIAAFTIPHLLQNNSQQTTQAKQQAAVETLQEALQTANTRIGLLPIAQGPGTVLKSYLNVTQFCALPTCNPPAIPAVCNAAQNNIQVGSYAVLKDGTQIYGLSPTWNTGVKDAQGNAINTVCVVTN